MCVQILLTLVVYQQQRTLPVDIDKRHIEATIIEYKE